MKAKEALKHLSLIILGMTIEIFILHIRFMNPILRRELILLMQEGNGYFLLFFDFNLLLFLICFGITIYFNRKDLFKKIKVKRND